MQQFDNTYPHRRKNILTGEWVLVSPQRTNRPWQGEVSHADEIIRPKFDPDCYLCPGNKRANGEINPDYKNSFAFTNDFSSLVEKIPSTSTSTNDLLIARNEIGICRVVNFSPRHDLTLAEMKEVEIQKVIETWKSEFKTLSEHPKINHVQIFENKGAIMGNSNPHPHCQIWAQESIPTEPKKELKQFAQYFRKNKRSLLSDYLKLELKLKERIVYENSLFVVLVPFWATWPYETMIISKKKYTNLLAFKLEEVKLFANAIKIITVKYDNLFKTPCPYSSGIHQAPTDGKPHKEWHFHMHFFPPLLRSASVKKYMVGYEMLAEPQRDITPEVSAKVLRELPNIHYKELKRSNKNV
ncbi:MAG: UDP-glucose--hexose-1-phosphate uridylyltransferase [Ignavibacteriaceae bacterium]|jgi:UDPglucose--hexose-1-phosphate uridylyltransferase